MKEFFFKNVLSLIKNDIITIIRISTETRDRKEAETSTIIWQLEIGDVHLTKY